MPPPPPCKLYTCIDDPQLPLAYGFEKVWDKGKIRTHMAINHYPNEKFKTRPKRKTLQTTILNFMNMVESSSKG